MSTWRPARPSRREQEPRPVGTSLDRLARRLGAPPAGVLSTLFARWESLVGPQVAAHATPVSLRDGVLVVAVDSPAWATSLRLLSADLLRRLAEATGGPDDPPVRELRVSVRPTAPGGPRR